MNYLWQLLLALASGAFGAWIATVFALKRFYSEKWWEKRAVAVIELTDSIYQMKTLQEYYSDLRIYRREGPDEYPDFVELDEAQIRELQLAASKAKKLIIKYSHAGQLLIPESVSTLLRDFLKEERKVDHDVHFQGWDVEEAEEHLLSMSKKLFEKVLKISREELKAG
ncbi:hypothetical protein [Enterobacter hormaechei]|uniref:hypothetical protein n=2 Tax=Enterobacter hormaechei TaxID=158836 RepID=UPI000796F6E6|nr:hypothetical protein [Enterobacter hormaechei]ELT3967399.1 hypothetical protein [Enterobacter hormaechei subsp. steigerwaltii]MWT60778.1 hypothetical protein [Escherichia coli]HCS0281098.1 hypothetical protein [Enterobacter hormaechei subsp. xiangfangensis]EKV3692673.1 hypothetical protein [Enterobacter hormaechei]EKV4586223.1 hypothetical protein [Enterobacter hormaechei]